MFGVIPQIFAFQTLLFILRHCHVAARYLRGQCCKLLGAWHSHHAEHALGRFLVSSSTRLQCVGVGRPNKKMFSAWFCLVAVFQKIIFLGRSVSNQLPVGM